MKIKPEDLRIIKDAVEKVIKNNPQVTLAAYQAKGLTDLRWRFDLFHAAQRYMPSGFVTNLYKYMNDSTIDTVLRSLTKSQGSSKTESFVAESHMDDLNALMSRVKRSGDKGSIKFVTSLIAAVKDGDRDAEKGIIHINKGEANLVPASVTKWLKESADMDDMDIQEAADSSLLRRMDKAEDRACTYFSGESCDFAITIGNLLRAGKKEEGLKMLQDPKNKGLLPIIPGEVRKWFGMTVSDSYQPSGETVSEDEWGGGFQSPADGNREVQAGLKRDFQRERAQKLKWVVQVIRGEITKQKFRKLAGISYDALMNPQFKNWYINQVKRMSKKALAPVNPPAPAAPTTESADIQEKVEIDGRTRAYRNTVMRLEQARRLRGGKGTEMQENKFAGLYDDGSGKGAIIPAPVDYNFHEAMKIVEKYRSLREKKKTLFGAPKGKMEDLEAAVAMKGGKFSMGEEKLSPKQKEYRAFFAKALKKFGHGSPADMDDAEKKKFFNWIEKNWKG